MVCSLGEVLIWTNLLTRYRRLELRLDDIDQRVAGGSCPTYLGIHHAITGLPFQFLLASKSFAIIYRWKSRYFLLLTVTPGWWLSISSSSRSASLLSNEVVWFYSWDLNYGAWLCEEVFLALFLLEIFARIWRGEVIVIHYEAFNCRNLGRRLKLCWLLLRTYWSLPLHSGMVNCKTRDVLERATASHVALSW